MNMTVRSPIIIIGMGRSGTSVLSRMLEALGLFVGWKKTGDHEAVFFQQLNKWLLGQCGGSLANPAPMRYLLEDSEVRQLTVDLIRYTMKTPRAISFLGWKKYLRYRTPANLDICWGWKDPRNTYTLPIWLDVFPEAKIIHIYRHGVDVANSFKALRERVLARVKARDAQCASLYRFYLMLKLISRRRAFVELRSASLEDGLSVWEEYIQESRTRVHDLQDRAIEIKYEDLLTEPYRVLKYLNNFCELGAADRGIEMAVQQVKKERAYAYRVNPRLEAFAAQMTDRLRIQGY